MGENMITKNNVDLLEIIKCPICNCDDIRYFKDKLKCINCNTLFDISNNIPVMIDKNYSTFIEENLDKICWEDYDVKNKTVRVAKHFDGKKTFFERLSPTYRVQIGPTYNDFIDKYNISENILELGGGLSSLQVNGSINMDINTYKDVDIVGDARKIPFKDNSFEAVISNSVLEHIYEFEAVIKELGRVVKKGGYIFMCVPQVCGRHHEIDYHRWTLPGLEKMFIKYQVIDKGVILGPGMFLSHIVTSLFRDITPIPFINKSICLVIEWLSFPFRFLDLLNRGNSEDYAHTIFIVVKKNS
jgi:SAM-dependent methyltransferase